MIPGSSSLSDNPIQELTISDIKNRLAALEITILKLICEFEEATKLKVISIDRDEESSWGFKYIDRIIIKVEF